MKLGLRRFHAVFVLAFVWLTAADLVYGAPRIEEMLNILDIAHHALTEHDELGMRAGRNGWKVVMVWGAIVTNPGTSTESPLRSYLFARNSLLLVRDYAGRWSALFRAFMILLNTLHWGWIGWTKLIA